MSNLIITILRQRIIVLALISVVTIGGAVDRKLSRIKSASSAGSPRILSDELTHDHEVAPLTSHMKRGFRINVHPSKRAPVTRLSPRLESERLVATMASELTEAISLPEEIQFSFEDCSFPDMYYDDESHSVIMCYQWIDDMQLILAHQLRGRGDVREMVQNLVLAVLLHETAHALIHMLKIPVTGREEDDADQFSTLVLLHQKDGARKALQVAQQFKIMSKFWRGELSDYSDEHSPDGQRYYDTLCMIYGRDPEANAKLVSKKWLPDVRADLCEDDYRRIESSWKLLLKPYAKDSLWAAQ